MTLSSNERSRKRGAKNAATKGRRFPISTSSYGGEPVHVQGREVVPLLSEAGCSFPREDKQSFK